MSEIPIVPMAQWVGQQGSEALSTGSNLSLYLHFSALLIRREIVTPPSPSCIKIFGTVRQKFFLQKIVM